MRPRRCIFKPGMVWIWFFVVGPAVAHNFETSETRVIFSGDRFTVHMICDLDAMALGVSQGEDSGRLQKILESLPEAEFNARVDDLRDFLKRRIRLRFDDRPQPFEVDFPQIYRNRAEGEDRDSALGTEVVLRGRFPAESQNVSFFASRSLPPVRLVMVREGGAETEPVLLAPGEPGPIVPLADLSQKADLGWLFKNYLWLGFEHIIPAGWDHVLFVLALFLLSMNLKPLLWQITAFTLAHSLTLGCSIYGLIALPSKPVEVLIALSIVLVAFENLFTQRLHPHRLAVVFVFGLLHGLGFAGVLQSLGLPDHARLTALLSFNLGVELGQVTVVIGALLLVGWLRKGKHYRRWVVLPGSALIGLTGLAWFVTRLLG